MSNLLYSNLSKGLDFSQTDLVLQTQCNNTGPVRHFFSPARVNLIGEHIDYCGGMVLPAAIDFGIRFSVARNNLNAICVYSLNVEDKISIDLDALIEPLKDGHWAEYIKGVVAAYRNEIPLHGLDIAILSDIPGGGLSSSAALEVGLAYVLETLFHREGAPTSLARRKAIAWRAQAVENKFVGVNCGIMDQAAVALGEYPFALYLDCRTLDVVPVPADLSPCTFVVCNTNRSRQLANTKYNERRQEVESALALIQTVLPVNELCDVSPGQKPDALASITDTTVRNRAQHVIEENHRVQAACRALENKDCRALGRLMNDSHRSLKELYQVSCAELDYIAEMAIEMPGVLGARMTGAGFGGCAILLVEVNRANEVALQLGTGYQKQFGFAADFYAVHMSQGTHEILNETIA